MKQSADRNASKLCDGAHVLRYKKRSGSQVEAAQPDKLVCMYEIQRQRLGGRITESHVLYSTT